MLHKYCDAKKNYMCLWVNQIFVLSVFWVLFVETCLSVFWKSIPIVSWKNNSKLMTCEAAWKQNELSRQWWCYIITGAQIYLQPRLNIITGAQIYLQPRICSPVMILIRGCRYICVPVIMLIRRCRYICAPVICWGVAADISTHQR